MDRLIITIVIPVYSGEKYLADLITEIKREALEWENRGLPFRLGEVIFVDDASIDNSSSLLSKIKNENELVKVVTLSKNFGQHPATVAGILHSSGDWIVTMDEDMQHHPSNIQKMLMKALNESCDIVYANALSKVHKSFYRDWGTKIFKRFLAALASSPYIKHFNSFRLIRGDIARGAAALCGHAMYLDIVFGWFTNRIGIVYCELSDVRFQTEKKSGYNFFGLLNHAIRMIVSSQTKILRIGTVFGLLAMLFSITFGLYIFFGKLFYPGFAEVSGWTSLFLLILFFGGLISFISGISLEYIGIILLQGQGKPTFYMADRTRDSFYAKQIK